MNIKPLDDKLAVSAQIALADIEELARQGYGTVICNRPDGEDPGQPRFEEIAAAARKAGMEAVFQPVTSATMGPEPARRFAQTVEGCSGRVLAYCRTGTRCTMLWTISGAMAGRPKDELRDATAQAGYDMTAILQSLPG